MNMIREDVFSFGTWVRRRRKALDLTQAAVASSTGCAEVTIRKLEAEVFRPSREIAERLADCLQIPSDERFLFLQVARGLRSVDQMSTPALLTGGPAPVAAPLPSQELLFPLDTVPQPAPLPPGSRMLLSRNPLFVGRDSHLRQLAQALYTGGTAAIGQMQIAAATGLGGIGKTQLACEFVHRYGQFFPGGVLWLSFADPAAIPAEVAACGGVDGMHLSPEFGLLPLDEQVRRVLVAWKQPIPRLLVLDNCEDEALLDEWHPKHGGCCVLITSRRRQWNPAIGVQVVPLDVLPRGESLALLHRFRPDLPAQDPNLHAIAEALGDLPLALHLAGSFLAKYRRAITIMQYRQRLQAPTILDDRSLRAAGLSPTKHVQHVARTFEQSYARLAPADTTDALALAFLARAACFAPGEPIPRWLLLQTLDLGDHPDDTLLAEDALARLIDLGLLETDEEDALRLHRLLVAFVRAVTADTTAHAVVEATMLRITDGLNMIRNPYPLLGLQSHLRFIASSVQQQEDERTAAWSMALGFHLWLLGVYPEAQRYFKHALAIRERVLGADHLDTAWSLNGLGRVLHTQGEYSLARDYYQRALAIRERMLGPDHAETAWCLNGLGQVLHAQGSYAEARRYLERALAIRERVLGPDHQDTAWSLDNLGQVLHAQGAYTEARRYLERALAIREQTIGIAHQETAWSLDNLGQVLHAQGAYAEARRYLEHALAIREQMMGSEHSDTAWSLDNLGQVLHAQEAYAEAQRYLERALAIRERVLGPDHPDTARSYNHLGRILLVYGQYVMAQDYIELALTIGQRVLGPDHPDVARSLCGLGELLHAQGDAIQARRYLEQALTIFEQRLGPQHSETEQTRRTLAPLDCAHER
ncbi:MAG TPA: tetratricopeptide repeat protein [Herpetosiphonaceae bacterium]